MDWVAFLATATVGFGAAQCGAWLQHRRDIKTQRARDVAEAERQSKQLEAQAREANADRAHAALLGLRDHRLRAYQRVSVAGRDLVMQCWRYAHSEMGHEDLDLVNRCLSDLDTSIDDAWLLCTKSQRGAVQNLRRKASGLFFAAQQVALRKQELQQATDVGADVDPHEEAYLDRLAREEMQEDVDEELGKYRLVEEEVEGLVEAWNEQSRTLIGIPDD